MSLLPWRLLTTLLLFLCLCLLLRTCPPEIMTFPDSILFYSFVRHLMYIFLSWWRRTKKKIYILATCGIFVGMNINYTILDSQFTFTWTVNLEFAVYLTCMFLTARRYWSPLRKPTQTRRELHKERPQQTATIHKWHIWDSGSHDQGCIFLFDKYHILSTFIWDESHYNS